MTSTPCLRSSRVPARPTRDHSLWRTIYLVWNVTKKDIKVREVVVNENAWPPAGVFDIPPMDPSAAADIRPSDWTQSQALNVTDVDQAIYDRINERYDLDEQMRMKQYFEAQKKSRQTRRRRR